MEYSSGIIIIIKYSLLNIRFRPHSSKSIHLYIYISSNSITPNSAHAFAFTQRSFIASIINARLRLLKQRNSWFSTRSKRVSESFFHDPSVIIRSST